MDDNLKCPNCGSTDIEYLGQIEKDEPFDNWECMVCGEIFEGDYVGRVMEQQNYYHLLIQVMNEMPEENRIYAAKSASGFAQSFIGILIQSVQGDSSPSVREQARVELEEIAEVISKALKR